MCFFFSAQNVDTTPTIFPLLITCPLRALGGGGALGKGEDGVSTADLSTPPYSSCGSSNTSRTVLSFPTPQSWAWPYGAPLPFLCQHALSCCICGTKQRKQQQRWLEEGHRALGSLPDSFSTGRAGQAGMPEQWDRNSWITAVSLLHPGSWGPGQHQGQV